VSTQSSVCQLYAWDVPTGELRQLTDRPEGVLFGGLSPDGCYVYYLEDRQGNEIGHFVRVPFEGARHRISPPRWLHTPRAAVWSARQVPSLP
jgi:Tol biopolymer transport system component